MGNRAIFRPNSGVRRKAWPIRRRQAISTSSKRFRKVVRKVPFEVCERDADIFEYTDIFLARIVAYIQQIVGDFETRQNGARHPCGHIARACGCRDPSSLSGPPLFPDHARRISDCHGVSGYGSDHNRASADGRPLDELSTPGRSTLTATGSAVGRTPRPGGRPRSARPTWIGLSSETPRTRVVEGPAEVFFHLVAYRGERHRRPRVEACPGNSVGHLVTEQPGGRLAIDLPYFMNVPPSFLRTSRTQRAGEHRRRQRAAPQLYGPAGWPPAPDGRGR